MGLLNKGTEALQEIVGDVTDTVDGFNPNEQVSRRHERDMLSDNKLSKNIRPVVLIWVLTLLSAVLVMVCCSIVIPDIVMETIFWAMSITFGFYFGGRSFEKYRASTSRTTRTNKRTDARLARAKERQERRQR